jgi:NADH dehydrogenase FAD-containing subunit
MSGQHRVLVIGGGFAGLQAVRSLRSADVEVTLVDPPQLPPVAASCATSLSAAASTSGGRTS